MTRRRPGRPALDATDPSVRLTLTLPAKRYDVLYREAGASRLTVPELIRQALYKNRNSRDPSGRA